MLANKSNLIINLIELKFRFIYIFISLVSTFLVCFMYRVELFYSISSIFLDYENGFIYTSLLDPIIIYLKLSFYFSLIIVLPFIIYMLGFFFSKGFYIYYVRFFFLYIGSIYILSLFLFLALSNILLPVAFDFLTNFQRLGEELLELKLQATITQYYKFYINYSLLYLLFIFIPNFFFILVLLNLVKVDIFKKHTFRKYLYLFIFILFLFIAPPDFLLQMIFVPFIVFFLEIYIYAITFFYNLYSSYE